MRNKDGSGGEYPVTKMWYGKGAGRTIEEIIDWKPDYFIWMVDRFLDVSPSQAEYWNKKFPGMELPDYVISPADVIPYTYTKESPADEYELLCKEYSKTKAK